jgi:hypothetical protein
MNGMANCDAMMLATTIRFSAAMPGTCSPDSCSCPQKVS